MKLFNIQGYSDELSTKYSKKVQIPQYEIKGEKPIIESLCNDSKTNMLIAKIKKSNVTEEEKQFLIKAARRHYIFNYRNIAEYYAHASKEMQNLMEESALVIIDINDAIANGYVKLSDTLNKLMEDNKNDTK